MLDGGGGWDGWSISLADYPVGSIAEMIAVNEPTSVALAAIGLVVVVGLARNGKRGV
jgi:hypothetical protein